ncbi:G5 domain-containing protein [Actinomyces trachealis]|uniref:aggregation-promoting factor C-terminal-like domain-containing protein n=1 Tax=Actinomyces trachealis TaxID=2763540 RepID=UPI001FD5547C|nr:G5 domain-containing protein [Actinomyces trachealis]
MTYERETDNLDNGLENDRDSGSEDLSSARTCMSASTCSFASTVLRAGVVAAVISMAVSGAAYAAAIKTAPETPTVGSAEAALSLPTIGEATSTPRAAPIAFTVVVDGQSQEASSEATTWGGALLDVGVSVNTTVGDQVSVELDAAPVPGQTLTVNHVSITTDVKEEKDPHGKVEEETDELNQGETKVKTQGVDGLTRTTYTVRTVSGQEIGREVASQVVTSTKTDEVVLVGTREKKTEAPAAESKPSNKQGSNGSSSNSGPSAQSGDSDSAGSSYTPKPSYAASGTSAGDAQATAKAMLSSYGWGESEYSCLVSLWNRESGWNYRASNPSSGAYGIPQSLPGSKMASAGADWQTNPATQIKWGLGYIQGRYGSPCGAWAHSEATGWY